MCQLNVFEYDLWPLPIFHNGHWALATLDLVTTRLELWDSCPGSIDLQMLRYLMRALIRSQWEGCMGPMPIPGKLKFPRITSVKCARQSNGVDCGVFLLEFCDVQLERPSGISINEVHQMSSRKSTHQIQLKGRAKILKSLKGVLQSFQ